MLDSPWQRGSIWWRRDGRKRRRGQHPAAEPPGGSCRPQRRVRQPQQPGARAPQLPPRCPPRSPRRRKPIQAAGCGGRGAAEAQPKPPATGRLPPAAALPSPRRRLQQRQGASPSPRPRRRRPVTDRTQPRWQPQQHPGRSGAPGSPRNQSIAPPGCTPAARGGSKRRRQPAAAAAVAAAARPAAAATRRQPPAAGSSRPRRPLRQRPGRSGAPPSPSNQSLTPPGCPPSAGGCGSRQGGSRPSHA